MSELVKSEERPAKKRRKPAQTYRPRTNAIHVTLYSPTGDTVPAEIREAAQNALWELAKEHNLLIGVATT